MNSAQELRMWVMENIKIEEHFLTEKKERTKQKLVGGAIQGASQLPATAGIAMTGAGIGQHIIAHADAKKIKKAITKNPALKKDINTAARAMVATTTKKSGQAMLKYGLPLAAIGTAGMIAGNKIAWPKKKKEVKENAVLKKEKQKEKMKQAMDPAYNVGALGGMGATTTGLGVYARHLAKRTSKNPNGVVRRTAPLLKSVGKQALIIGPLAVAGSLYGSHRLLKKKEKK